MRQYSHLLNAHCLLTYYLITFNVCNSSIWYSNKDEAFKRLSDWPKVELVIADLRPEPWLSWAQVHGFFSLKRIYVERRLRCPLPQEQTCFDSNFHNLKTLMGLTRNVLDCGYCDGPSTIPMKARQLLCVCLVAQSHPTLCDPLDYSLPGSCVLGIFQARLLEWVAISYSRASARPRDRTRVSRFSWIAGRFFTHWADREALIIVNNKLCWYDVATGTVLKTDIHHGIGNPTHKKEAKCSAWSISVYKWRIPKTNFRFSILVLYFPEFTKSNGWIWTYLFSLWKGRTFEQLVLGMKFKFLLVFPGLEFFKLDYWIYY